MIAIFAAKGPWAFRLLSRFWSQDLLPIMEPYLLRWSTSFYQALQAFLLPKFHQKRSPYKSISLEKEGDLNSFSSFFSSSSRFARPIPRRLPPWLKTQLPPSMPLDSEEVLKILSIVQMFEGVLKKNLPIVIFNLHVRNFALKCIPFITIHASWGVRKSTSNKTLSKLWGGKGRVYFFRIPLTFWSPFQADEQGEAFGSQWPHLEVCTI